MNCISEIYSQNLSCKEKLFVFNLLIAIFFFSTCRMSQLNKSLKKFSLKALQLIDKENGDVNTVFSPYSAFVCVAMSIPLFKDETRAEILQSLQISIDEDEIDTVLDQLRDLINFENTKTVFTSNRIWANEKLDFDPKTFLPNEKILGIPITKVNFPQPGCDLINEEVNRATHGMIDQIVNPDDLNPLSTLVILNAIYFKCSWEEEFEEIDPCAFTRFTLANGSVIKVTMLISQSRDFDYAENDSLTAISIPYLEKDYDFVIILPKPKEEFEILKKITYHKLNKYLLSQMRKEKLSVMMPKFTIEMKLELTESFKKLGLIKGFSNSADFVDSKVPYKIDNIIQKAKIIVDEKGTVAAAATEIQCMTMGIPKTFKANRPFLYLIRNKKTNTILFEGFMKNPNQ